MGDADQEAQPEAMKLFQWAASLASKRGVVWSRVEDASVITRFPLVALSI